MLPLCSYVLVFALSVSSGAFADDDVYYLNYFNLKLWEFVAATLHYTCNLWIFKDNDNGEYIVHKIKDPGEYENSVILYFADFMLMPLTVYLVAKPGVKQLTNGSK